MISRIESFLGAGGSCCEVLEVDVNLVLPKGKGESVLMMAARAGRPAVLRYLLDRGAAVEFRNREGKAALHEAAQFGHGDCVRMLLEYRARVDALKQADWTALMLACTKSDVRVVAILLEFGADVSLKNKDGWNCFHIACREGNVEIVQALLDHDQSVWKTVSKNGRTPLHTVALHGQCQLLGIFQKRCGFAADMMDSCGTTPLMDSLRAGHVDVARQLIVQFNEDVYKVDKMGRMAIHQACQAGSTQSVVFLVQDQHVPMDVQCEGVSAGMTGLHFAAKEGQLQVLKVATELGANVQWEDASARTALHMAAGGQHEECTKFLLSAGAVDAPDKNGLWCSQLCRSDHIKQLFLSRAPRETCNQRKD